jgi:hypothetical protein
MATPLEQLEEHRDNIYLQMSAVGDFRPGMISVNFRRCGKKNCACFQPDHPGHGPQYLWNTTQKGVSRAQNLRMGPELEKTEKEIANYRKFARLYQEAIEVNEKICLLRPVAEIDDEHELQELKKKLKRRFSRKPVKKSIS